MAEIGLMLANDEAADAVFDEASLSADGAHADIDRLIIHAIEALGESIAIVENHGVDARQFVDLLTSTLFGGVSYTVYGDIRQVFEQTLAKPGGEKLDWAAIAEISRTRSA